MRGDLHRAARQLAMGRSCKALLVETVGVVAAALALWIIACAFVLMEPERRPAHSALGAASGMRRALACGVEARPCSYGLLNGSTGVFAGRAFPRFGMGGGNA